MRYLIVFGALAASVVALIWWAAATGKLDCEPNEHSEIVSYYTTTQTVGKTHVTNTHPIYACVKN